MDAYEEYKKQFTLPPFEEMDAEFEISSCEEDFLLRNIRKKIAEKLEFITNLIVEIINPESSSVSLYESSQFSDKEKEELLDIFNSLMYYVRQSTLLSINDSDKLNVTYINKSLKFWEVNKLNIVETLEKMRDGWIKNIKKAEVLHYFG